MSGFRFYTYTDYEYRINQTQKYLSLPISLVRPTKPTTPNDISHELNIPYTVFEILVAIFAIVGNLMVIIVFQRERKLQRRTNYYIVSLAIADFLVGSLGVPFAIMASIGLPTNLYACLFTVSLLVVLCTISIFCLLAVSVDRYWAILYPMAYSRTVRTRTAIGIISMCWLAGALVGFMPLFGWHANLPSNQACLFVEVMDYDYLVFLYFATIITPAILMLAFYTHIYRVIVKQVRQIVTMNPLGDCSRRSSTTPIQSTSCGRSVHGGTMLRVLGAARKRDVKATQNLSIIVLFFMICWIPLYTINCIQAFCRDCVIHPKLTLFCIILSHLNSAVNPVLYAYHLKDFRAALKNLILRIIGVDVEQPVDTIHRFSVPSQHRLHSTDQINRHSLQPRLYIDSPVWLRQQQQQQALTLSKCQLPSKCGVVPPCLNNINQAVAAVASVNASIGSEVWTIIERTTAPNGKTNVSFELDENAMKLKNVPETCSKSITNCGQLEDNDNSYSYINEHVLTCASEVDLDDVFYMQKDTQNSEKQKIQREVRLKLRSDVSEDQSDSQKNHNCSELERSKQHTPSTNSSEQEELRPLKKLFSRSSSSSNSPANSSIFTLDNTNISNSMSPVHRPRFKPSTACQSKTDARAMLNRSFSCTSDPVTPNHKILPNRTKEAMLELLDGHEIHYDNIQSDNTNFKTIQHPKLQQNFHADEKFKSFKAMSQLLFPPVVKHSSLFHIFQPTTCDTASLSKHSKKTKTHISAEECLDTPTSIVKEHKPQPAPLKII